MGCASVTDRRRRLVTGGSLLLVVLAIALAGCEDGSGAEEGESPPSRGAPTQSSQPGYAPDSGCPELARQARSSARARETRIAFAENADERTTQPSLNYHRFVGGRVLLVGDSHTWASQRSQRYSRYDVDARCGRGSKEAYAALDRYLKRRHRKVVFDIASNDCQVPLEFQRNLRRVWMRIQKRSLVLVTARPINDACVSVNRILKRVHRSHSRRTALVPWARYAKRHPKVYLEDGIHFSARGYAERARMVQQATRRL